MKRSPLLRKKPLRRSAFGASPMPLSSLRSEPLRRTRMRRKAPRARADADPQRLAFIRSCDCCACGKAGPSHAHHRTLSGRGKGQKSPDSETLPLCAKCHDDLHTARGKFRFLNREQLRSWQVSQVAIYSGWYARLYAVREAV